MLKTFAACFKFVPDVNTTETENKKSDKFVEGIDYYFDEGLMVLTARFLLKRGYCCGNDCRHCPYPKNEKTISQ